MLDPVPAAALVELIKPHAKIATVEEHFVTGGLGSIVAEVIADAGLGSKLLRIGVDDAFPDRYTEQEPNLRYLGLDSAGIAAKTERVLLMDRRSREHRRRFGPRHRPGNRPGAGPAGRSVGSGGRALFGRNDPQSRLRGRWRRVDVAGGRHRACRRGGWPDRRNPPTLRPDRLPGQRRRDQPSGSFLRDQRGRLGHGDRGESEGGVPLVPRQWPSQ